MNNRSKVILAKKLWNESESKQELKDRISRYMAKNYPGYRVIEIHKYYAICDIGR